MEHRRATKGKKNQNVTARFHRSYLCYCSPVLIYIILVCIETAVELSALLICKEGGEDIINTTLVPCPPHVYQTEAEYTVSHL